MQSKCELGSDTLEKSNSHKNLAYQRAQIFLLCKASWSMLFYSNTTVYVRICADNSLDVLSVLSGKVLQKV